MAKFAPTSIGGLADIPVLYPENPPQVTKTPKTDEISTDYPQPASDSANTGSFSFTLKPVRILKKAIEALAERDFNPRGFGRIDVDQNQFEITVHNPDSHVTAFLSLDSAALIDFKCPEPVLGKRIDLAKFLENLVNVTDDEDYLNVPVPAHFEDSLKCNEDGFVEFPDAEKAEDFDESDNEDAITIKVFDGSTTMVVNVGNQPSKSFTLRLLETTGQCYKIESIISLCSVSLESKYLNQIKACRVGLDFTKETARLTVGGKPFDLYEHISVAEKGLEERHKCIAHFELHHIFSLLKASAMRDDRFSLTILRDPANRIMVRFDLHNGYLGYVMEATAGMMS